MPIDNSRIRINSKIHLKQNTVFSKLSKDNSIEFGQRRGRERNLSPGKYAIQTRSLETLKTLNGGQSIADAKHQVSQAKTAAQAYGLETLVQNSIAKFSLEKKRFSKDIVIAVPVNTEEPLTASAIQLTEDVRKRLAKSGV